MPLAPGSSKEVVSKNIKELYDANTGKDKPRSRDQIVAIALEQARRTGKAPNYRKRNK